MINWGMAQPPQQNNALAGLAQGLQVGRAIARGREEREGRNALAQYAANPTREGVAGIAQYNPDFAMQEGERYRQEEVQAQQQRQQQDVSLRRLLEHAGTGPEGAQQALAAAQQMGIDVTRFPQPGSPEFEPWRQQQLFIAQALETPEGRDELTAAAQEIMYSLPPDQRDVNNPNFIAAMQQHLAAGRIKTLAYQPGGNVIAFDPGDGSARALVQGQDAPPQSGGPTPGTIEDGYRFIGGDPANPASWERVGGAASNGGGNFPGY